MNKCKCLIVAAVCFFAWLAVADAGDQSAVVGLIDMPSGSSNFSFSSVKTGIYKNEDFIKITLKNKLFSPNNTTNMPHELVFEIEVLNETIKVKKWRLDIINSRRENVFTAGGESIPSVITWNGTKDEEITEGKYKYVFTVELWKKDKMVIEDANIIVDATAPLVLLKSSNDVAVLSDGILMENFIFSLGLSDETGVNLTKTKLLFLNAKNEAVVKSWNIQSVSQQNIRWDGRDDIYERIIPPGEYKIALQTRDLAGNEIMQTKNISVIELNAKGKIEDIVVKEKPKALAAPVFFAVFFKSASASLTDESLKSLATVAVLLKEYPVNNVLIEGHTDSFESKTTKKELELANKRAQAVYDFFIKNEIAPERLQAAGYGKAKPAASNKDSRTRILNRRVDVFILKNDDDSGGKDKTN